MPADTPNRSAPLFDPSSPEKPRLLLLASKLGYQTRAFAEAAERMGADVVIGSDRCHQLEDPWSDGAIALHFEKPEEAAARSGRGDSWQTGAGFVFALGDEQTVTRAYAARLLGLRYNSPAAVENCRSKLRQREVLRGAGVPGPDVLTGAGGDPLASVLPRVPVPCVLKPLSLAGQPGSDSRQ